MLSQRRATVGHASFRHPGRGHRIVAGIGPNRLCALAGQRLLIEPTHLDVGAVEKASVLERELRVLNLGWKPFRLLGSQSSCGCISLDEFPIVVPAREGCTLKLEIGTSDKSGPFRHTIKFFSDTPGRISVVVPVTGIVL